MGAVTGVVEKLSSYDDNVPHPGINITLAQRFQRLRSVRTSVDLNSVREVVAVVSSSRGGSTMLGELLRRCDHLLSLPGEMNPYVAVAQMSGNDREVLAAEIAREIGRPAAIDEVSPNDLGASIAWRLQAQWPECHIALDAVADALRDASGPLTGSVLSRMQAACPAIDPSRYDDSTTAPPAAAPAGPVVEMAPFVGLRPWRLAGDDEVRSRPLVIATPRNAYRLPLLRALFPRTRVRVLHLTRNPAASVNGLIDGWRHPGFHNVDVGERLDIAGYSDAVPGGTTWWKFDVPPEWHSVRFATLPEVCALQWCSAHEAVLADVERHSPDYLRVRYEDLVGTPERRADVAGELADWLHVPA